LARRNRARFVALTQLIERHHPEVVDADAAVRRGLVAVEGVIIRNPAARVRANASVRLLRPRRLRGHAKLTTALDGFALEVSGMVAVDIGAAAGGFASALLERGAARVYAVDVGYGQLAGWLRQDERVVDLERTNVASVDSDTVPDTVDLVTVDVSYLAATEAVRSVNRLRLARGALLVALIKPTFELRAASLVTDATAVRVALSESMQTIDGLGWQALACTLPTVTGAGGAVEPFVLARRLDVT
jgi:23S rRNA (cytidine1920-2'-O)/16S rRNA (cytidine1409-2'-O)-methyltransferase